MVADIHKLLLSYCFGRLFCVAEHVHPREWRTLHSDHTQASLASTVASIPDDEDALPVLSTASPAETGIAVAIGPGGETAPTVFTPARVVPASLAAGGAKLAEAAAAVGAAPDDSDDGAPPEEAAGVTAGTMPAQDLAGLAEYQCASDQSTPTSGCEECTMSAVCTCTGFVKMGYGDAWSEWVAVDGNVSCSPDAFGGDPRPGFGKVCICQPQVFLCAMEQSTPSPGCANCPTSTICTCEGQVRFGYGTEWTPWVNASGPLQCQADTFGEDPLPGQGKQCQCRPSATSLAKSAVQQKRPLVMDTLLAAVIAVSTMYFFIHAALACVRSNNQFANIPPSSLELELGSTVSWHSYFGPMLCSLLLTARQRVQTLTADHPQEYGGYPPLYVKRAAVVCSFACVALTLCHFLSEVSAQATLRTPAHEVHAHLSPIGSLSSTALVHVQTPAQVRSCKFWQRACGLCNFVAYGALAVIVIGVSFLKEPAELMQAVGRTPAHIGTQCNLAMACGYFVVYFVLYVVRVRAAAQMERGGPHTTFGVEVMKLGAAAVNVAPMICNLFVGLQLSVDWLDLQLPAETPFCMIVVAASVFMQVFLVIIAPFLAKAELQATGPRGELDFVTRNHFAFVSISMVRWLAMTALYIGIAWFAMVLLKMRSLPALIQRLCELAGVYFSTYMLLWGAISVQTVFYDGFAHAIRTLTVAKDTVVYCPMIAALCITAWVRAHEFDAPSGQVGEPQGYVQSAVKVVTIAVALQLLVVIVGGAALKPPPSGGSYQDPCEKMGFTQPFFIVYHVAVLVQHSSVVLAIAGICMLRPWNATGYSVH